jgi:hypothetical protein
MWCIYTIEYYSVIKKNEILPFSGKCMKLEVIILIEIRQAQKGKYLKACIKRESRSKI